MDRKLNREDFIRKSFRIPPRKPTETPPEEQRTNGQAKDAEKPSAISLAMMDKPLPSNNADRSSACVAVSSTLENKLYDNKLQKTAYETGVPAKIREFPNRVPWVNRTVPIQLKSFKAPDIPNGPTTYTNGTTKTYSDNTTVIKIKGSNDMLDNLEKQISEMEKGIALNEKKGDPGSPKDEVFVRTRYGEHENLLNTGISEISTDALGGKLPVDDGRSAFNRSEGTRHSTGGANPVGIADVRGRALSNLLKSGLSDAVVGKDVMETDGARPSKGFTRGEATRNSTGGSHAPTTAASRVRPYLSRNNSDAQPAAKPIVKRAPIAPIVKNIAPLPTHAVKQVFILIQTVYCISHI